MKFEYRIPGTTQHRVAHIRLFGSKIRLTVPAEAEAGLLVSHQCLLGEEMGERFIIVSAEKREQMDQVRALFREYGSFLGSCLCFQSFDAELAGLPGEYSPPEGRLLLALCDLTPAGCVALRKLEPAICEMKRLYVRPEFRGHGVGRDLVMALIERARQSLYERMRLDTVTAKMAEAVSLYRSLGFREIAPYQGDPVPGAIHMELDLRQA